MDNKKKDTKKNNIKKDNHVQKNSKSTGEKKVKAAKQEHKIESKNSNNIELSKDKKSNKFIYIVLAVIIFVVLFIFLITRDDKDTSGGQEGEAFSLKDDDPLTIGEKKYLEFLWLVDGAFNDSRYNSKLKVNGKTLEESIVKFNCVYDEQKEWCRGDNFENAFSSLFSRDITYDDVYGDGLAFNWYEKRMDGVYFKNITACDIQRMSTDQKIELIEQTKDKLTFKVSYTDNIKSGIYKGEHRKQKDFVLVKEDSLWKVSKAYYHDLCFQDYSIPKSYS